MIFLDEGAAGPIISRLMEGKGAEKQLVVFGKGSGWKGKLMRPWEPFLCSVGDSVSECLVTGV